MKLKAWSGLIVAAMVAGTASVAFGEDAPKRASILETKSLWRVRMVNESWELVTPEGEVLHGGIRYKDNDWYHKNPKATTMSDDNYTVGKSSNITRIPETTSPEWMQPGFDDGDWARSRIGISYINSTDASWKLILARGTFYVEDPAEAGDLKLNMAFAGGAVVYLNGEEVGRAFVPKTKDKVHASAERYPDDVYFDDAGFAIARGDKAQKERLAKRVRRINGLTIPAAKLVRGVNTLAVAVVRAPMPVRFLNGRKRGQPTQTGRGQSWRVHNDCLWGHIGLMHLSLTAADAEGIRPNIGPVAGRGFRLWNMSMVQRNLVTDYAEPFAPVRPVRMAGTRNGTFAGMLGVGDEKPIRGLKVATSDLKGPGVIPASAVQVRYVLADGRPAGRGAPPGFDSLEDEPLEKYPVHSAHGGSLAPLWIRVRVPANAAPGAYQGSITVSAEGVKPQQVPLIVQIESWTLPPVQKFHTMMDYVQSPESVAATYKVPMWSDEHFKQLDRTFSLLAEIGCKTLYITAIRRTHWGNEHAMIRWTMDDDGNVEPDFSIAERYLATAVKRLGKIPGIILNSWEPAESAGHALGAARQIMDKRILITVLDPETGRLSPQVGPAWGTPEAKEFWKQCNEGFMALLKKRGLEDSLMFGLIGDARPTKQAMNDATTGVKNAKWAVHSHFRVEKWQGYTSGMSTALWGIRLHTVWPPRYGFGWASSWWLALYARQMYMSTAPVIYRTMIERWVGARRSGGPRLVFGDGCMGLGRIGADFWRMRDSRGNLRGTLAGRYPESSWGQLRLDNSITAILAKGKHGAIPSVRSEQFRENLQEIEARVYLEKVWLDPASDEIIGAEKVARIRSLLDDRIRIANNPSETWFVGSGWAERNRQLFALAGEAAAKYGDREPKPNLKDRNQR